MQVFNNVFMAGGWSYHTIRNDILKLNLAEDELTVVSENLISPPPRKNYASAVINDV